MFERVRTVLEEYKREIVFGIGVALVATIAFQAGRMSVATNVPIVIQNAQATSAAALLAAIDSPLPHTSTTTARFVGSKNGTAYHWRTSPWAERIKPENRIYFSSESEAEAAGYKKSKDFEKYREAR